MKINQLSRKIHGMSCALGLSFAAVEAGAAVIQFDSSSEFAGNFRRIVGSTTPTYNTENQFMAFSASNQTNLYSYDTDGAGSGLTTFSLPVGSSLTVSTDVRFSVGGLDNANSSSVGIYFGNYLALLNVASTNETLRIGTNLSLTDGGVSSFSGSGVSGVDLVPVGDNAVFVPISATMTVLSENNFTLSFTVGSRTYSQTIDSVAPSSFVTGLRFYNVTNSSNVIDFDNYSVDLVPEPSVALLSLGGAAAFCLRRRRARA
jgi:hypothetical protein